MKFELEVSKDPLLTITLKHNDRLVLISGYMSRVLDVIEDIVRHDGRATLIPYPVEGEK